MKPSDEIKNYVLDLGSLQNVSQELPRIYYLKDRFKHTYIIGKTGTGKSTLMLNMALYDIEKGLACIFIDPKGDKVQALNNLITDKDRIINLSFNNPIKINPLRKTGYNLSDLIEEFVEILDILITLTTPNPEATALMYEIIDRAIKSFTPAQRQIDYLSSFLMYENTRKTHLKNNDLPYYLEEYWKDFDKRSYTRYFKSDTAKRIASRLDRLISDSRMKKIVCGENELDIADIARNKKVLLVDTSKMGFDRRIFISNLITHAIKSHCEYKGNEHPLLIYVDEFQLCFSPLFSHLFAIARDQNVGFVLAHQNIDQISKEILGTILGNFHAFITFRCGEKEANEMAKVYNLPYVNFLNLKDFESYIRIGIDNTLVDTNPPPEIPIPQIYNFLRSDWIPI